MVTRSPYFWKKVDCPPYRIVPVDISKGEQFKAEFLAFSPNNRMPAIIDRARFEFKTEMDEEARGHMFRHASAR